VATSDFSTNIGTLGFIRICHYDIFYTRAHNRVRDTPWWDSTNFKKGKNGLMIFDTLKAPNPKHITLKRKAISDSHIPVPKDSHIPFAEDASELPVNYASSDDQMNTSSSSGGVLTEVCFSANKETRILIAPIVAKDSESPPTVSPVAAGPPVVGPKSAPHLPPAQKSDRHRPGTATGLKVRSFKTPITKLMTSPLTTVRTALKSLSHFLVTRSKARITQNNTPELIPPAGLPPQDTQVPRCRTGLGVRHLLSPAKTLNHP
jgi:hypothetical protein